MNNKFFFILKLALIRSAGVGRQIICFSSFARLFFQFHPFVSHVSSVSFSHVARLFLTFLSFVFSVSTVCFFRFYRLLLPFLKFISSGSAVCLFRSSCLLLPFSRFVPLFLPCLTQFQQQRIKEEQTYILLLQ